MVVEGPTWTHFCKVLIENNTKDEDEDMDTADYFKRRTRPLNEYLRSIWLTLVMDYIDGIPLHTEYIALQKSLTGKSVFHIFLESLPIIVHHVLCCSHQNFSSLVDKLVKMSLLMRWKPFKNGTQLKSYKVVTRV